MKQLKTQVLVGFLFLLCAIAVYVIAGFNTFSNEQEGFFVVNFGLTLVYWLVYLISCRELDEKPLIQDILIALFFISAHTLNREIEIFADCSPWFLVLQVLAVASLLLVHAKAYLPNWINMVLLVVLSLGMLCWLYMTIYVAPYYVFGLIGIVAIGIGLHIFVPALLLVRTFYCLRKHFDSKEYKVVFWSITSVVTVATILFVIQWNLLGQRIGKTFREAKAYAKDGVPAWISVVKEHQDDWWFSDFVKMQVEYQAADKGFRLFDQPSFNESSVALHNPFIILASVFSSDPLFESDKIQILKAMYGYDALQEMRLWTGKDLYTEAVTTEVQLWPSTGIQYTEHTFQVTNGSMRTWSASNEAIYLFQLPSGGAVTSLSLWVNGVEQKAVLTTKKKAAEAYKNIVGVQRRDPSWVEWREGNKVAVRVFPVNTKESRIFKIGITAPMKKEKSRWLYQASTWEGPVKRSTRFHNRILFEQDPSNLTINNASLISKNVYEQDEVPSGNISVQMDAPEKLSAEFGYDQHRYYIENYLPSRTSFDPTNIYLDINSRWTNQEISAMKTLFANKNIYVYNKEMIQWKPTDGDGVLNVLRQKNISCFPFFLIKDKEQSMLITKPSVANLAIENFEDSDYAIKLKADRDSGQSLRCFLLNASSNGYYKTLIDSRYLLPELGSTEDLKELLVQKQFAISEESDQKIVIPELGVQIQEDSLPVTKQATDHIYRLFQYNQILRKPSIDSATIERAEKANVVSPVSSLIVLESAQDYKNQGIDTNTKGLGNASINSTGAAPEPHEWVLIILFTGAVVYWFYRRKKLQESL